MYVAKEGTIYKSEILKLCEPESFENEEQSNFELDDINNTECSVFLPIIIVVPVRLGLDKIEPCYYSIVKTLLSSDLSLGIIGGKPNSSLFFIGFQSKSF